MKILTLNCGSSSVKFQLIDTDQEKIENSNDVILAKGVIEKIGLPNSKITYSSSKGKKFSKTQTILEHHIAINKALDLLTDKEYGVIKDKRDIKAVGHRIVHGGQKFSKSTLITDEVFEQINECSVLAPLHNPHNIKGYLVSKQLLPSVPQTAVFDTGFHHTIPDYAYLYGLPYLLYEKYQIRRYGFHGISHRYITKRMAQILSKPVNELNLITCHLGNGCSISAVKNGKSIDTSMGFTPLEGLLMGTRSGDMDPSIILYIMEKEDLLTEEANTLLNKHSGLQGISGISNDLREIYTKSKDEKNNRCELAINMFSYRLKKYIGSYISVLNGCDAIVFTAGIGENAFYIREKTLENMDYIGIKIDKTKNENSSDSERKISTDDSKINVYVVSTNEELLIARDTFKCVQKMG